MQDKLRFIMQKKEVLILPEQVDRTGPIKPTKAFFEHRVSPEFIRHFTVSYHDNYKVVKTDAAFYPRSEETTGRHQQDIVVLVQKGTTPLSLNGPLADADIVYVPVETVAINGHHAECFLRELGLESHINAIGSLYSFKGEMREKAISGKVGQIGYNWQPGLQHGFGKLGGTGHCKAR